jgi:hypothetical protein
MIEFVNELQNPMIVAVALIITELIKNQGWLQKIDTRAISLVVSALLVIIVKAVLIPADTLMAIENLILLILPSIGWDYLYKPVIKPIIDMLR